MSVRDNKKQSKDKRIMENNAAIRQRDGTRSKMASYISLNVKEDGLFCRIDENLFQLEQNVEFFSFAIKEIEEITKQ